MSEDEYYSEDWGGKRPRAGRPRSKSRRVSVTIQIPKILKAAILQEAKKNGLSFSRAAENRLKRSEKTES